MPALAVILFLSIYLPLASMLVHATSPQTTVAAAPAASKPVSSTPAAAAGPAPVSTARPAASFPGCTPLPFGMPSQLSLDDAPAGLRVQTDAPTQYQIYGDTASELRTQIQHCAPGASGSSLAEYTGQTSYNLSWQYAVSISTKCSAQDIKVGVHTATALPYWQPTGNATSGLAERWQAFDASLRTHEQGHAVIDKAYAAKLLDDLNALGPVDCDNLTAAIRTIVDSDVAALNQANDTYDRQTDHGATQGAVLPAY
jgi:predicted secreted Zn-dependent protease